MARDTVTIEGLDDVLRRLKALGPMASQRGGPVRAAVRRAAVVIQKEMQDNIQRIMDEPNRGGDNEHTGTLRDSVRPIRARAHSRLKGETFYVWIPKRARYEMLDARGGTKRSVAAIGQWLEYGTSKRKPMPWARPAYHSKKDEAVEVMREEILKGIEKIERKLAKS